ncbi:MAG: lysylphosphatidylglycerol synthase transmembrane domain-containing protein [Flavobacteriales bacterium]
MKKITIGFIKNIFPLLLGVFLIYYSYSNTSPADRQEIYKSLKYADYRYIALSIFLAILSHLSRSYRWRYLLNPMGYNISFLNSIMSVLVGFLSNLGIPRSGEFLRASSITLYEKVPFEKGFGTIITERIIDVIILLTCILIGLSVFPFIQRPNLSFNLISIITFIVICFIIRLIFKLFIKKTSFGYKIKIFISGLKNGVLSIFQMPKKEKFIIHTLFIWMMYFLMLYVVKFSIPETFSLEFGAIFSAFVAGTIAMSLTNGGIGAYPLAIAGVISQYDVPYESALAYGWIVWTSQTIMILIFGSLSFIFLPILNKIK